VGTRENSRHKKKEFYKEMKVGEEVMSVMGVTEGVT